MNCCFMLCACVWSFCYFFFTFLFHLWFTCLICIHEIKKNLKNLNVHCFVVAGCQDCKIKLHLLVLIFKPAIRATLAMATVVAAMKVTLNFSQGVTLVLDLGQRLEVGVGIPHQPGQIRMKEKVMPISTHQNHWLIMQRGHLIPRNHCCFMQA